MTSYRAVVIDDEQDARTNIKAFAQKFAPKIEFVGEALNARLGQELIEQEKPNIIFLDVHLGDAKGTELIEKISYPGAKVIFTTAYSQYALEAFKLRAVNYLLKPIDPNEFEAALEDVCQQIDQEEDYSKLQELLGKDPIKKIGLSTKDQILVKELQQIERLQADSNYTQIYLRTGSPIMASKTLKVFEDLLSKYGFIRVHQSHLVRQNEIVSLHLTNNELELKSGAIVPFSRRNKSKLIALLKLKIR